MTTGILCRESNTVSFSERFRFIETVYREKLKPNYREFFIKEM
jgi:hypothetical protein